MGDDFSDVKRRLVSERLIEKFVLLFPEDDSYRNLCTALENKQTEEAFRASHTLTGVAQNLGFSGLCEASTELTELLRAGVLEGSEELLLKVTEAYENTCRWIERYRTEMKG